MSESKDRPDERPPEPGTVTKVDVQKHDLDRVSIFLDGRFALGVHREVARKFGVRQKVHLTVEMQEEMRRADQIYRARKRALDYLAYKNRTAGEVRRKLLQSDYSEVIADDVVARLEERGYVDDEAYAELFAEQRARRGYGPRRVRNDLKKRGVERRLIDVAIEKAFDRESQLEAALERARKRVRRLKKESDLWKRRQKLSQYLARRGFPFDIARRAAERLFEEEGWG